jgi:hypothetical protein
MHIEFKNKKKSQAWWCKTIIPALRKERQENHKFPDLPGLHREILSQKKHVK